MFLSLRCLILAIFAAPLIMVGCTCSHQPTIPSPAVSPEPSDRDMEPDINEMPTDDDDIPAPEDMPQERTQEPIQPESGGDHQ